MNTLVRTLLVWLVLLAVPFQGFAAAAMTCAHGMPPATQAQQEAKPPCHGEAKVAARGDIEGEGAQSHDKKCGNCAACSVGAAMAPGAKVQAPDCCPCRSCPAASPPRIAAADPDLPERPPRLNLA